jgi:hypothetical protein
MYQTMVLLSGVPLCLAPTRTTVALVAASPEKPRGVERAEID